MSGPPDALVRRKLERARETLGEARDLHAAGRTIGVVNRAYYACFYAVCALLLTENLSSSKHSGVRSFLNRDWIKTGKAPRELGEFYGDLFSRRQEGDCADLASYSTDEVGRWLTGAHEFVDQIAQWISANAGVDEGP